MRNEKCRGGSRIFFRRGCTRLLLYFNTNKPHGFFCRIPVVLENRRSSQGGGGVRPPPRSAPEVNFSTTTSLYLVTLKIFESKKLLRRLLHEIQGKWGGRNFITVSRVNSRLITHPRIQRWIWNLQLPTVQLSSNKFINGLLGGDAWPGLPVKYIFLNFEYRTEISFVYMNFGRWSRILELLVHLYSLTESSH